MKNIIAKIAAPNNGIKLSIFRILFGLIIFWEFGQLCLWKNVGEYKFINTVVHFKFPFFSWVKQLPDEFMNVLFFVGVILSILFILGAYYKYVSVLLFVLYSYLVLIDISYWNNHYYFYMLILFLFIFSNANYRLSIDKKRKKEMTSPQNWNLWIMCFTVIVVLFYGAISKLNNPDWFSGLTCYHLISNRFTELNISISEDSIRTISSITTWGGFFFDLLIGFVLLRSKWFIPAVLAFLIFNVSNMFLFHIGSFPFAMIGALTLFIPNKYLTKKKDEEDVQNTSKYYLIQKHKVIIVLFVAAQILIPLRHFFIQGNVLWTGEGKLGSWHMMSASVDINANTFFMEIYDDENQIVGHETISTDLYLNKHQKRTLGKFPFTIKQFSDFASKELEIDGYHNFAIFPDVFIGRNGRTPKPVVGRKTDLRKVVYSPFKHNDWILLYADTE